MEKQYKRPTYALKLKLVNLYNGYWLSSVNFFHCVTNDYLCRKFDLVRCLMTGELLEQCVCSRDAFCLNILVDCGKCRSVELSQHVIIKSNNGYFVGNINPSVMEGTDKSYSIKI